MDWQLPIVLGLVAAAAAYLGWQSWRSWHPSRGKCGGCGCISKSDKPTAAQALLPPEKLQLKSPPPQN